MPRPDRSLTVFALLGAVVLVLPLSACGRKGALDPPPGGYALDRDNLRTPVTGKGTTMPKSRTRDQEYDENGRPIAPEGQRRSFPGDWLIK